MRPDCCLRGPTANTISLPALHLLSIQRLAFCPTVWLLEHLPVSFVIRSPFAKGGSRELLAQQ